jgi:hypothetical protein
MTKRFFAICLVLVLVTVTTGADCPDPKCDIFVDATLCGEGWSGDVQYSLNSSSKTIQGTLVPKGYFGVDIGTWTCQNISGGPPGAYLHAITPSPTQAIHDWGRIYFHLNFEMPRDPSIKFLTWTINGETVDPNEPDQPYEVNWGDIIDVHFEQHVAGCKGAIVEVIEQSELLLHYAEGPLAWVGLHVLDDLCAVTKDPGPVEQVSHHLYVDGDAVEQCMTFDLILDKFNLLEVQRRWKLTQCTDYEKTINWLRIGDDPEPTNGDCLLFELLFENPGTYYFKLVASAEVDLVWKVVDIDDPDTSNNSDESPPLYIVVEIGL